MLAYRGTNWLYHFEIDPIDDTVFDIIEYDEWITDIEHSWYGLGLYFYTDILDTREFQYTAVADIDAVTFDVSEFNESSDSYEGSVYRLLVKHDAITNPINRARYFKTCLDIVLNTDVKAIKISDMVVVYELQSIRWDIIEVNDKIQYISEDPFQR